MNNLTGTIPPSLSQLFDLYQLSLGQNNIEGTIPYQIGHREMSIDELSLYDNKLIGQIPASFGNLTHLAKLLLYNNVNLTGCVPLGLSRIPLTNCDLSNTNLSCCNNKVSCYTTATEFCWVTPTDRKISIIILVLFLVILAIVISVAAIIRKFRRRKTVYNTIIDESSRQRLSEKQENAFPL
eukprot:TRINITY_DN7869_c0_g1_i1.p1 TRINITY_DN7869_c0_g1~~TRINITY_DN7869_c0_g1_i1.p1  ORF type:complete len:182 (+),score=19.71 TRINITY_DN7869_c0_g1_i1:298-843(+)